jgi:hypothetical protein
MGDLGNAAGGAASGAAAGAVLGPYGALAGGLVGGAIGYFSGGDDDAAKAEALRKQLLYQQAGMSGQFADNAQAGYGAYGQQAQQPLTYLQRTAQGENSVSSEQLRQALQQNVAAQRSLAAGASPQNAAMAARTAAIQSGRLGAGLAGQQAVAGLQERAQANQAYGSLLGTLRGQDLNAALSARQNAMTGYGANNAGAPPKSWIEQYGPAIQGGLSAYAASQRGK